MQRRIVALGGLRGCGKSTIAGHLVNNHGFEKIAFSDILREIALLAGIELVNDRVYLSKLGEILRSYDSNFLLKAVDKKITASKSNIVIEDVRFQSELKFCLERNIQMIYLEVSRDEQIRRIQKREQCDLEKAEKLIDLADEHYLTTKSGWDQILQSEGDFREIAERITKSPLDSSASETNSSFYRQ